MKINLLGQSQNWKEPFIKGFETNRLIIRPMESIDITLIIDAIETSNELLFVKEIDSLSEMEKWLQSCIRRKRTIVLVIYPLDAIGDRHYKPSGFLMLDRRSKNEIELGGLIKKNAQKMGYASEVVLALISCLRQETVNALRLYAEIRNDNKAAEKVLSKYGFKEDLSEKSGNRRAFYLTTGTQTDTRCVNR